MPKLHVFALCEKVIMDEHKNPSLIVLMENFNVSGGQEKIPRDAVTPREWAIFTQWQLSEEEQSKPLVQVLHTFWPDGKLSSTKRYIPFPRSRQRSNRSI